VRLEEIIVESWPAIYLLFILEFLLGLYAIAPFGQSYRSGMMKFAIVLGLALAATPIFSVLNGKQLVNMLATSLILAIAVIFGFFLPLAMQEGIHSVQSEG
jgi:hypothetical protein